MKKTINRQLNTSATNYVIEFCRQCRIIVAPLIWMQKQLISHEINNQSVSERIWCRRRLHQSQRGWLPQQDNHPKPALKTTMGALKRPKLRVLQWSSQFPDQNTIKKIIFVKETCPRIAKNLSFHCYNRLLSCDQNVCTGLFFCFILKLLKVKMRQKYCIKYILKSVISATLATKHDISDVSFLYLKRNKFL